MFVNYQTEKNNTVSMLSTVHSSTDVDETSYGRNPRAILFSNKNNVGVDCFDQMARMHSSSGLLKLWVATHLGSQSVILWS